MVRKSILVYDLLRTEQPQQGFSEKEIVDQICNRHDIAAGKGVRRQVAVALRRGLDFGILAKKNNRFRREASRKKSRARKKQNETKKKAKQRPGQRRNKNRKQSRPIPQPNAPKSWTPSRRNLTEEPLSKVKKI
ncbi:hypothetical protein WN55_05051 [Dufourea novaeangliae]|uniref:H15 domain-containing protein n=1 Tax=Dufourea novaeangliae TaxID=178035 RepID=A0A154PQU9_DUFNO|nr:hypothetical protein WN55_05051 [Dufourea novaeangliae]